jgi:6-phosphogluconolactonase (cycloisomerase 2 family)
VDGIDGAFDVAASADGAHVYVAGGGDNAVATFDRDPGSGALAFVEQDRDGVGGVDGIAGAFAVAAAPDGANVYVVGANETEDALAIFSRDAASGALAFVGQVQDGVDGVDGLDDPLGVAASPDDGHIYVTGHTDGAVATFARAPGTGELSFVEQDRDGVDGVDGLAGAYSPAVSPDGAHVYVAGYDDSAVATFAREPAPPDTTDPDLELSGKKRQRLAKKVKVKAECTNEPCEVSLAGKLATGGRSYKLKRDARDLEAGVPETLRLKLPRKARRAAEKALDDDGKAKAKLTARATDAAGNAARAKRKVKLRD